VVSHTDLAGNVRRNIFDLTAVSLSIEPDIDLATDELTNPFIELSTGTSWSAVATAYQRLAEPQIQPDRVEELMPSALQGDSLAAIQWLVSRLHKEIRYNGI
jgi:hypothetical protein